MPKKMSKNMEKGEECKSCGVGGRCKCPHHKMFPVLMLLFALLFLLGALDVLSARVVDLGWPILVGLAAVIKLGNCKCCSK